MSQLQDFEEISRRMGKTKRDKLEIYLDTFHKDFAMTVYSEEEWAKFESWLKKEESK